MTQIDMPERATATSPTGRANAWLADFERALVAGDTKAATELFVDTTF